MRLPRPIQNSLLPLLLLFAAQKVCAQLAPADDFFNGGAQLYISNNIPAALERTENGLKLYPNDEKLQKLEKLLKQQQQQQNQKNQQQNKQQSSQKNSQDQKKSDEQKQNQAEQQKSNGEKKENQNDKNPAAAGQMTPEEAKKLLDAQKGDEQVLQLKPQGKPQDQSKPVKDW